VPIMPASLFTATTIDESDISSADHSGRSTIASGRIAYPLGT
jgi:hypothetical protein